MTNTVQIGAWELLFAAVTLLGAQFALVRSLGAMVWKKNEERLTGIEEDMQAVAAELKTLTKELHSDLSATRRLASAGEMELQRSKDESVRLKVHLEKQETRVDHLIERVHAIEVVLSKRGMK